MRAIRVLQRLMGDCRGATAIEYGLIVSLIVIAIIVAVQGVADANSGLWAFVREKVMHSMGG